MKKAFDQNVSRAKPRLKLGAPAPDPSASESGTADEAWVYEVAAQVAGQPEIAEADAPTAREVMAAAAATVLEEELSARDRVEATLREAAAARAVEGEEQVTVAVGVRARGESGAQGTLAPGSAAVAGPPSASRRAPETDARPRTTVSSPAPAPSRAATSVPAPQAERRPMSAPLGSAPAAAAAARPAPSMPVRTETLAAAAMPAPVARRAAPPAAPPPDDAAARRE